MGNIPENILEAVRRAAEDNSLSCARARKLAEELKVAPRVVGEAADQLKIKIKNCELGCF
ncbi:Mn-dependent DtxR family transcriptional regulator [Desulfohalotomaculum tongense]|uniref:hypothetical protein n=1 Tax=Desulforadius tongensis TaxID=1216062 RepID=UPI001957E6C6|nr:hypothetical protein [Desulforadius tongensis]MBM7855341.1 Mn-dependent DtxR family transcriptional regulator [Desulforadius tongensis]